MATVAGIGEQQRTLTEVVEQQPGQNQAEPRDPDRQPPEMPHVRVERLGAGDREKHGAERDERQPLVSREQGQSIARIERQQHVRALDNLNQAQNAENGKP